MRTGLISRVIARKPSLGDLGIIGVLTSGRDGQEAAGQAKTLEVVRVWLGGSHGVMGGAGRLRVSQGGHGSTAGEDGVGGEGEED